MLPLWIFPLLVSMALANPAPAYEGKNNRYDLDPHYADSHESESRRSYGGYSSVPYYSQYFGAPYGHRAGGGGDRKDLAALAQFIQGVIQANSDLGKRIYDGKDDQADLIDKIEDVRVKLQAILDDQTNQTTPRLRGIATRIADLLVEGGDLESRAAGVATVTKRFEKIAIKGPVWERIDDGLTTLRRQRSTLVAASVALNDSKEAIQQGIEKASGTLEGEVDALETNIENAAALVNTRHCFSDTVSVDLTPDGVEGVTVSFPDGFFSGNDEPTLFLAAQGVSNVINLKDNKAGGYGGYGGYSYYGGYGDDKEERRQSFAGQARGDATNEKATIKVIDLSQGQGNFINGGTIAVKACSLPAQSGALHLPPVPAIP